jgi:hypothetical protein
VLHPVENPVIPSLPKLRETPWLRETRRWWKGVWSSPMVQEFDDSDLFALQRVAILVDMFYEAVMKGDINKTLSLSSEIRQQEFRFGLTPMDRRRLQWTIEQGDSAKERTDARKKAQDAARPKPELVGDPRTMLA